MTWERGQSGNPKGRPRRSVAAEMRRIGDPAVVAERVWRIITDPHAAMHDVKWALQFYCERVEGKAVSRSQIAVANVSTMLPPGFAEMTPGERGAWADQLRAQALAGELTEGGEDDQDD